MIVSQRSILHEREGCRYRPILKVFRVERSGRERERILAKLESSTFYLHRAAVPFRGQPSQILSNLSPNGTAVLRRKRVKHPLFR